MFDVAVANDAGIIAAILFQNIAFWCQHSIANGRNYYDGEYWTYNTNKAFCELFPYMTSKSIRTALQKLIECDLIITGNYNDKPYDRTIWYTLSKKGKSIFQKGQMELPVGANGIAQKGEPIPYINTDINTDINKDSCSRFIPPTVEEVRAYANEKGWKPSEFDPEYFINFYASKGWKIGKNTMTNWRASASGWVARERKKNPINHESDYDYDPWGIVK